MKWVKASIQKPPDGYEGQYLCCKIINTERYILLYFEDGIWVHLREEIDPTFEVSWEELLWLKEIKEKTFLRM